MFRIYCAAEDSRYLTGRERPQYRAAWAGYSSIHVLLPQMFRVTLPPLGTRMVHNFKNTSLCMAISVPELTWATQQIESLTFRGIEATMVATLFYIALASVMVAAIILLEKFLKIDVTSISFSKA